MDLDAEQFINDEREAMIQAEIIRASGAAQQPQQGGQEGGAPSPMDPSGGGGGNIGVGSAPQPGEQGFSAAKNPAEQPSGGEAQALMSMLKGGQ